jgi:hypothetical protein
MSDVDEFEVEYVAGLAKQVEQLEARNKELEEKLRNGIGLWKDRIEQLETALRRINGTCIGSDWSTGNKATYFKDIARKALRGEDDE